MFRIAIRSRLGNGVLAVLGVIYFLSATSLLIYYVVTTWGAAGLIDRALQLALLGSAVGGLFFILIAVDNLALRRSRETEKSRSARDHRTTAAAQS